MLLRMSGEMGPPIHYSAVARGTPVYGNDGEQVGTVRQVVDNYREHILDGFVIEDRGGEVRFVDGPEVVRTCERGVTLSIDAAQVGELPPPEDGPGVFGANLASGRLGRMFGGAWRRK